MTSCNTQVITLFGYASKKNKGTFIYVPCTVTDDKPDFYQVPKIPKLPQDFVFILKVHLEWETLNTYNMHVGFGL